MPASTEKVSASNAPEIVVSTVPAELVVTEGPAAFVPLVDDLLVLNNSDDDVFMHLSAQDYYIVLAGRWYRSKSLNGPWAYQDSDSLPTAFAQIPQDSEQADSRVYVAGTQEAQEAVLDAQVPQTAAIKRGEADVDVQYDGEPVFEPVDGTDMVYANNTGSTVILADGLYYLVEDGVWYVSTSVNGPWQVSLSRPDQVRVIQPSSPVYNVKYVYVYDYTPQVVYMGYTPGYAGSYVYRNTVFYGSGYYYRPWVSPRYYYPYPSTWGFHVNYDPWYGWNFGLSWAWGPFSFSYWPGGYWHYNHYWHHRHYSYWGPHGYRPRYHHHRPPHHRPPGHGGAPGHGRPPGSPHPYERNHNLYRDAGQRAVVANSRDKAPRSYAKRPAEAAFNSRSYAKNGIDGKAVSKEKTRYSMQKPVSRGDLAVKAKKQDSGFKASQKKAVNPSAGKAYSRAYAAKVYDGTASKTPAGKVTRNDLASKAKSSEQGYRASQKKVVSASGNKPGYSKSLGGKTAQPKVSQKSYVKSSPKVNAPTTSARTKLYNSSKTAPLAKRSAKVTAPSSSVKARTNYRMKSTPVVKLTKPSRPSTSYSKAKSSTAPSTRSQPKPQYSYQAAPKQSIPRQSIPKQSAPKQSAARQSTPKQAWSAPGRSAPQKSSKPAMNNKSKQGRVK